MRIAEGIFQANIVNTQHLLLSMEQHNMTLGELVSCAYKKNRGVAHSTREPRFGTYACQKLLWQRLQGLFFAPDADVDMLAASSALSEDEQQGCIVHDKCCHAPSDVPSRLPGLQLRTTRKHKANGQHPLARSETSQLLPAPIVSRRKPLAPSYVQTPQKWRQPVVC